MSIKPGAGVNCANFFGPSLIRKHFLIFSGNDDIFVTTDMWNGPYYWNKENLPEEWENIFSFSQPNLEEAFPFDDSN